MPYAKKRTYRKKSYARRSYARKSNLAREVRLIKRTIKPELKLFNPNPGTTVSDSPVYDLINDPSIGTTSEQRIGNQINTGSVHIRGTLAVNPALTITDPVRVRLMLVWYKQPDGYALDDATLFEAGAAQVDQFTSWEDRKQFKVLYDRTVTLCQGIKPVHQIRITKKINRLTEFSGTGDLVTGALYWIRFQDLSGGAGANSEIEGQTFRVFYTDC